MRFFKIFTLLIVIVCGALTVAAQTKPPVRKMAVTIDDLPWVGSSNLANTRRQTKKLLSVLRTHRAPAVGFVNEGKLQVEVEARTALLQDWVDAGMILGNHTYSHADFNALTVEQFAADILKGESVTRRLMRPRLPYQLYFRSSDDAHRQIPRQRKRALKSFSPSTATRSRRTPSRIQILFLMQSMFGLDSEGMKRRQSGYARVTWTLRLRQPNLPNVSLRKSSVAK